MPTRKNNAVPVGRINGLYSNWTFSRADLLVKKWSGILVILRVWAIVTNWMSNHFLLTTLLCTMHTHRSTSHYCWWSRRRAVTSSASCETWISSSRSGVFVEHGHTLVPSPSTEQSSPCSRWFCSNAHSNPTTTAASSIVPVEFPFLLLLQRWPPNRFVGRSSRSLWTERSVHSNAFVSTRTFQSDVLIKIFKSHMELMGLSKAIASCLSVPQLHAGNIQSFSWESHSRRGSLRSEQWGDSIVHDSSEVLLFISISSSLSSSTWWWNPLCPFEGSGVLLVGILESVSIHRSVHCLISSAAKSVDS